MVKLLFSREIILENGSTDASAAQKSPSQTKTQIPILLVRRLWKNEGSKQSYPTHSFQPSRYSQYRKLRRRSRIRLSSLCTQKTVSADLINSIFSFMRMVEREWYKAQRTSVDDEKYGKLEKVHPCLRNAQSARKAQHVALNWTAKTSKRMHLILDKKSKHLFMLQRHC